MFTVMQILIYDNLPFLLKLCYTVRKRTTEIGMIESGMPMETAANAVRFTLGGLIFEYDPEKNRKNIEKHGISFKSAARVFFIMIVLNYTMRLTAGMKTAMIR